MAIIPTFPGVQVGIRIAGATVNTTEHADPDKDDRPANLPAASGSSYVESRDNAEFLIHYVLRQAETAGYYEDGASLSLHFFVDGKRVDKKILRASHFHGGVMNGQCRGIKESIPGTTKTSLRRFRFASVATVDEADHEQIKNDLKTAEHLGVIRVDVHHKRAFSESGRDSSLQDVEGGQQLELSEKALKGRAISHGTSYSPAEIVRGSRKYLSRDLNHGRPLASFVFKYRSKDALRAELIVPRTPSPSVEETHGPKPDGDAKKIKKDDKRAIKSERKRSIDDAFDVGDDALQNRLSKIVKREAVDEVIDLTEDN